MTTGVAVGSAGTQVPLAGMAEAVIQWRVDLIHFPFLFYFYSDDQRALLPCALFPLIHFAEEGRAATRDEPVLLAAAALTIALNDLADLIGDRLDCQDRAPESAFRKFAKLHMPGSSRR